MTIQIILAITYFCKNLTFIPSYGDTKEYFILAETGVLDAYRQPLYPWFLLFCHLFEVPFNGVIPIQTIAYIFQLSINFMAFFSLFSLLLETAPQFSPKQKHKYALISTFFLFTNPLVFHFNMTILPDGLCLSSFILFLCGCLLLFPIGNYKVGIPVYIIFFISTSLLRSEKAYILLGATILIAFFLFFKKRISKKNFKATILMIISAFILFSAISYMTHVSNDGDTSRTINIERTVFIKTTWPRLERVYPYLPEEIQLLITPENTVIFDEHTNNIRYYADLLESANGGSNHYLRSVF